MAVTSIQSMRGGRANVEFVGLKPLQLRFNSLVAGIAADQQLSAGTRSALMRKAREILGEKIGEAASLIRDSARSKATAGRWPAAVVAAIFKYSDLSREESKRWRGAIVGVRTGAPTLGRAKDSKLYVEWTARSEHYAFLKGRKRQGVRVSSAGRKLGMSLGRIMESGTGPTRRSGSLPREAFGPALRENQRAALASAASAYQVAIEWLWGQRQAAA